MYTLTIEVKDDFITEFMDILDDFKDNVKIKKDENLESDPCFYERQKNYRK